MSATRARLAGEGGKVLDRGRLLSPQERKRLPKKLRQEIAELEARLRRPPDSIDAAHDSEQALEQYERAIDAALAILEPQRLLTMGRLGRTAAWAALLLTLGAPFIAMALGRYYQLAAACAAHCTDCTPRLAALAFAGGELCESAADPDCTEACAEQGRCRAEGGRCVAVDGDSCERSEACRQLGHCSYGGVHCAVGSDADCQGARVCHHEGRCWAERGRCVALGEASCPRSRACSLEGLCRLEHGVCSAGDDADCGFSLACVEEGRCHAEHGVCVARYDEDCWGSRQCTTEGHCLARGGRCVAGDRRRP